MTGDPLRNLTKATPDTSMSRMSPPNPYCYMDAAKAAIATYIDGATRFLPQELCFIDEVQRDVPFRVEVKHQLSCRVYRRTVAGRLRIDAIDLKATSHLEFHKLAESLRVEAHHRTDVFREMMSSVIGEVYGRWVGDRVVREYDRAVYWTYPCKTCAGSGEIACGSCYGVGHESCTCCSGSGYTDEIISDTDHNGHSLSVFSQTCCYSCHGSGQTECTICDGRGKVTCKDCDGHGELTDCAYPEYVMNSTYRLSAVSVNLPEIAYALNKRARLPEMGKDIAKLVVRGIESDIDGRLVRERVEFRCLFYQALVRSGDATVQMIVFGDNCSLSDVGGLVETLVQPDLNQLQAAVEAINGLNLVATFRAKRICRLFLTSEVHQDAIECPPILGKTQDAFNALSDRLARALSPEYLFKAVWTLDRLARTIQRQTQRLMSLVTLPMAGWAMVHIGRQESYLVGVVVAAGVLIAGMSMSRLFVKTQLLNTGGQLFLQFANRRRICAE